LKIEAEYARVIEGDQKKSAAILEEIVKRYPDDKWSHCDLGAILYFQRRYADAAKAFEGSLRLDPEFSSALNWL
jgi:tetratricopeptide (TPR) repeat protein